MDSKDKPAPLSRSLFGKKIFPESMRMFQWAHQKILQKKNKRLPVATEAFGNIAKHPGYWAVHILKI